MKRINSNKMELNTPEFDASKFINLCLDDLNSMDEYTFETWLSFRWKSEEIVLGGKKLKVPETKKKAILHFIAFWYYRDKEQEPS